MAVSERTIQYAVDQLSEFGEVTTRKMFGGVGIYRNGIMFGLITSKNEFMLRVGDETRNDYENRGSKPLTHAKMKHAMPYWEVPAEIAEDRNELRIWAEKAYEIAAAAKKK
ncbi:MAG: hypothetical protein GC178_02025 [Flavobacteriales bacterium]|nr:hypothetical protein [Flavobacteriales bacterium]